MKTEILKIKGDWGEVLSDCRLTVGKPPLGKEPSAAWKRGILIAEHSPIRDLSVRFRWAGDQVLGSLCTGRPTTGSPKSPPSVRTAQASPGTSSPRTSSWTLPVR